MVAKTNYYLHVVVLFATCAFPLRAISISDPTTLGNEQAARYTATLGNARSSRRTRFKSSHTLSACVRACAREFKCRRTRVLCSRTGACACVLARMCECMRACLRATECWCAFAYMCVMWILYRIPISLATYIRKTYNMLLKCVRV